MIPRAANESSADGDSPALAVAVGARLKETRKNKGLTLVQLANASGLSQPFLSQVENGKAMPSLTTLHSIAKALDVHVQDLLEPRPSSTVSLIRHEDHHDYEYEPGIAMSFLTDSPEHSLGPSEIVIEPGIVSQPSSHRGEEFIYVIEGELAFFLEDEPEVVLGPGDAYLYAAMQKHWFRGLGDSPTRFIMVGEKPDW